MELLKKIFGSAQEISPYIFSIRTILVGILLFVEGKVLPHRAGGQFAGFDFVFFWMMGGITAAPLLEPKISFVNTVAIIITVYVLHYLISYIAVKNRAFAKVVFGRSITLVSEGKLLRPNMAKAFFPLELLLSDMRNVDVTNIGDAETVILETSGHVSVLKRSDSQPVTPKDLNIETMGGGYPTVLINEGKIVKKNLTELGYDEKWLKEELLEKGILNVKDVYAALIDSSGELYYSVVTENKKY